MKNLFFIIEGGLATTQEPRWTRSDDKVVRFENHSGADEPAAVYSNRGLRALDDSECFDLVNAQPAGCILDFEYNGVPARHGFLRD